MINCSKISPEMEKIIEESSPTGVIDIIVELNPNLKKFQWTKDRKKIAQIRETSFKQDTIPIIKIINELGGSVKDQLWINRTIRAVVPISGIARLCEPNVVQKLDVPRNIQISAAHST